VDKHQPAAQGKDMTKFEQVRSREGGREGGREGERVGRIVELFRFYEDHVDKHQPAAQGKV